MKLAILIFVTVAIVATELAASPLYRLLTTPIDRQTLDSFTRSLLWSETRGALIGFRRPKSSPCCPGKEKSRFLTLN
jgi:hypothetical protein